MTSPKTKTVLEKLPTKLQVSAAVDKALSDYAAITKGVKIPVNVERLLEVAHDAFIIPTDGLEFTHSKDCAIAADFKSIYIDKYQYENESYEKRVRSTMAHELGHIMLHQDFFKNFTNLGLIDENDRYVLSALPGAIHRKIEDQAYEFAGGLLVPRQYLIAEASLVLLNNLDVLYDRSMTVRELVKAMSSRLAEPFAVSDSFMRVRIDRENLAEELVTKSAEPLAQYSKAELLRRLNTIASNRQNIKS